MSVDVEASLAEVARRYLTLSDPTWKSPGSAASDERNPGERTAPPAKRTPAAVDLTVLDALGASEAEVLALVDEARAVYGMDPLPTAPRRPEDRHRGAGTSRPNDPDRPLGVKPRYASMTPEAVAGHIAWLDKATLPADLAEQRAELTVGVSRDLGRVLGLERRITSIATCPECKSRSVILDPKNDDVACCANRRCQTEDGQRHRWSRAAGEWTAIGWQPPTDTLTAEPVPA